MCQPVTLSQNIIDFVDFPLAPTRRQAGAHRAHAGRATGFQCRIALELPSCEAAGLAREIVKRADEGVEALADLGGIEWLIRIFA